MKHKTEIVNLLGFIEGGFIQPPKISELTPDYWDLLHYGLPVYREEMKKLEKNNGKGQLNDALDKKAKKEWG